VWSLSAQQAYEDPCSLSKRRYPHFQPDAAHPALEGNRASTDSETGTRKRGSREQTVYRGVARGVQGDPVAAGAGGVAEVGGRQELEAPEHEDGGKSQHMQPRAGPRRRLDVAGDDALPARRLLRSLAHDAGGVGGYRGGRRARWWETGNGF
jgi:hypothetical protein